MAAGYSNTPLAKKLSLRDGQRVWFDGMPEAIQDDIGEYALELTFVGGPEEGPDAAHIFVTERAQLEAKLQTLRDHMARDGRRSCRPTSPRTLFAKSRSRWALSTPRSVRWTRSGRASSW